VQDRCGVPFALENITYYFELPGSRLREAELLTRIVERADCGLLLDLNNLYVNSRNHNYDPYEFMRALPLERVLQIHIAGAVERDTFIVDSHAHPTGDEVFEYLRFVCEKVPPPSVVLERDQNLPPFAELLAELRRARAAMRPTPVSA
jgi:uncharacterized protein (UPF0276 family)